LTNDAEINQAIAILGDQRKQSQKSSSRNDPLEDKVNSALMAKLS
jgi:hypothetical protein